VSYQAVIDVEIRDGNKDVLYTIGPHIATYRDTHYESIMASKDEYKQLLGDAQARVSIGMDEKIAGPHYSSVSIRVNITVSCDQETESIRRAQEMLTKEAMAYLEGHYEQAMERLREHLKHLYPEED
jgi:hypothetical protein